MTTIIYPTYKAWHDAITRCHLQGHTVIVSSENGMAGFLDENEQVRHFCEDGVILAAAGPLPPQAPNIRCLDPLQLVNMQAELD